MRPARLLRRWLGWIRSYYNAARLTSGIHYFVTFVWATRPSPQARSSRPVTIGIRTLDGREVMLRPGTTDGNVAIATFVSQVHLPPAALPDPRVIWDLGANIGLTMAHMAHLFPRARIVGVEMDHGNARLARENLLEWGDRCDVIEAAVWPRDGTVSYARLPGHGDDALRVTADGYTRVQAISLMDLLEVTGAPDYVKMDIEGAEQQVLRENTGWAQSVRSIGVECHPPYTLTDAQQDLERLGFRVKLFPHSLRRRANSGALGVRHDF